MATTNKKKTTATATEGEAPAAPAAPSRSAPEKPRNVAAYEAAVAEFASASGLVAKGAFAEARPVFEALAARMSEEEPILADRARSFLAVCVRRLAASPAPTEDADELFHRAVFASNSGRYDEALALLDAALRVRPEDASAFYARASVRGLQGRVDEAAGDLKRAVALDPRYRFQAAPDPDFERVRDEAAFIDVIEPTGAGA